MSAERLREAADRLDALADEASEGPWRRMSDPITGRAYIDEGPDTSVVATQGAWRPDMAYIAAMHPLVAADVVEVLRETADHWSPGCELLPIYGRVLRLAERILEGAGA